MNRIIISPTTYLIFLATLVMLALAATNDWSFPLLSLDRSLVMKGEAWRLLTGNWVHFGWAHTFMNLAAFLLCGIALLSVLSVLRFVGLFLFCCLTVGMAVYLLNPEYDTYAGLSGAIHGFIIAGLLLNKRHALWVNGIFIGLTFAKIIHEHQADYQATQLQNLLPVGVAYDAHLYGALAGLLYGTACLILDFYTSKKI